MNLDNFPGNSSWNLPPGCTPRDIDRAAGELAHCASCHNEVYRDTLSEDGLCRTCQRAQAREDEDRDEPRSSDHQPPPDRSRDGTL